MTIADKLIRAKEDFDRVYEAGYEKGSADGGGDYYDQGYADGKKAEYDAFWDVFQYNGERKLYQSAFYANGWTKQNFRPKYGIKNPSTMASTFFQFNNREQDEQIDLVALAEELGVEFDFSGCTHFGMAFATGGFSRLGTIDLSSAVAGNSLNMAFYGGYNQKKGLQRIERLICSEQNRFASDMFQQCRWLEHIGFEGTIAQNGLNLQWSPKLSRDSIVSVVNALSPTTTGLTVTLSKTAVESAFDGTPVPVDEYVELSPSCHGDEYSFETSFSGNVASVTVNGGRGSEDGGGSNGYINFFINVLPAGEYEISFSTTGYSESAWSLACGNSTTGTFEPLSPGGTMRVTINDGEVLSACLDLAGIHNNFTASVSIKRISYVYTWEALEATKSNWTITLA